jgi:hypothetical protein
MLHLARTFRVLLLFTVSTALAQPGAAPSAAAKPTPAPADPEREATRAWLNSLPVAPKPELTKHGLVAEELRRWKARGAGQGVAVDDKYFYGIGNFLLGKYDKRTGERVAEWISPRGGPIIHLNYGYVDDGVLVVSHSNFPQMPMASSLEYFDPATLQPIKSYSLGMRLGSLTWAQKKDGFWWVCFANYNDQGTTPGFDNRWTTFNKFDEHWQLVESWLFPQQFVDRFGVSSCSGGSWGDDGLLYVTGHDAKELYVLRLPKMGVRLDYITTIDVPFEGQAWAWDHSEKRVIYGIGRRGGEVIVARIPEIPAELLKR